MSLLSPRLQQWPPLGGRGADGLRARRRARCSAIAVDAPSPLAAVSGIRWGSSKLQGPRSEMEDDLVLRSDAPAGFSFAAVFDGHAGFSSVEFLRDELYKECIIALEGGILLNGKNFDAIKSALQKAFDDVDSKLLIWLESLGREEGSGATATVMFVRNDFLIISHVGDSCVVLSRNGKAEVLTSPHRPYGNNRASLEEVRRIRAAGGWIVDGRICGDISVSRAFGDMRFKIKKNEMLEKGVEEGRWSQKFASRIKFKGDLVTSSPDIYQVELGSDAEFILLASDGLWDYMKSSEAVAFVRNQLREHGDVQLASEALAHAALDQRSQDNVSILIADLGGIYEEKHFYTKKVATDCRASAMALPAAHLIRYPTPPPSFTKSWRNSCRSSIVVSALPKEPKGTGGHGRRIWRRRKLTKKDDKLEYKLERIPFLEEQVRRVRESGEIISLDIERLMLSEENRFAFVNEVAAEAKSYVERNRAEYGAKKAILHVLSNRMNEAGFQRTEAYMEPEPFRPGPGYIKDLEV